MKKITKLFMIPVLLMCAIFAFTGCFSSNSGGSITMQTQLKLITMWENQLT